MLRRRVEIEKQDYRKESSEKGDGEDNNSSVQGNSAD
jgi:hypothetical protein